MGSAKALAKEIVMSRKTVNRLYENKAQLNSISMHLGESVVFQMEHGILHLADRECPRVMVLVDCEGLSPLRLPMQMIRSCALLFQDNFPHCLGSLYVIRLPPVIRMMVQTLMKVLNPVTQQKLKFFGLQYQDILSEFLKELPACLGGKCTCSICSSPISHITRHSSTEVANQLLTNDLHCNNVDLNYLRSEIDIHPSFDQGLIRTCMIGILILCVFVALLAGLSDTENWPSLFL